MASAPYEPPQSIIIAQFLGLRNTASEERLKPGDLSVARNVVIDDEGQMRDRGGFVRDGTAVWHSFCQIGGRSFAVKDGVLGLLAVGHGHTGLSTVGSAPLDYTAVGDVVYFSSSTNSGQISATNAVTPWGVANDVGQWVSPVLTPTATMGAISGRKLRAPPLATKVEYYRGRIYLAAQKVLWVTELYLYSRVDNIKGAIQFEHNITLVRAVDDGLYVGTERQLFFLRGNYADGLKRELVLNSPVVAGSDIVLPASKSHPAARQQPIGEDPSVILLSGDGVCVGLKGGQVYNLTQDRVVFPAMTRVAALWRDDDNSSTYVIADAGGTAWSMNTRTGAVTEFENYTFESFAPLGAGYVGATPSGIYDLGGVDDAGVAMAVRVRGGLLRFGGTKLSRLAAAYITTRTVDTLRLKIETGDGVGYLYEIVTRAMRTMKVHMGKGQRATHFNYELTAATLNLDTLEFVPIIMSRRV